MQEYRTKLESNHEGNRPPYWLPSVLRPSPAYYFPLLSDAVVLIRIQNGGRQRRSCDSCNCCNYILVWFWRCNAVVCQRTKQKVKSKRITSTERYFSLVQHVFQIEQTWFTVLTFKRILCNIYFQHYTNNDCFNCRMLLAFVSFLLCIQYLFVMCISVSDKNLNVFVKAIFAASAHWIAP